MTTSSFSREIPLAFPKVNRTKPLRTGSRLAGRTSRRRSGSSIASAGRLLRPQREFRNPRVEEVNCVGGRADAARDGGGRGYRWLSRLPMFHDGRDNPPGKPETPRQTISCRGHACQLQTLAEGSPNRLPIVRFPGYFLPCLAGQYAG